MKYIILGLLTGLLIIGIVEIIRVEIRLQNNNSLLRPMTKQEIVLECQKLAANKTQDNWSYKSCLKELLDAQERGILQI